MHIGSTITWEVQFTDTDSGDAADPDTVEFFLREEIDGTELRWIYSESPSEGTHYPEGFSAMTKEGTGNYRVRERARKPERHSGLFVGSGNDGNDQVFEMTVFVRHSPIASRDP